MGAFWKISLIFVAVFVVEIFGAPADSVSFVASSTEPNVPSTKSDKEGGSVEADTTVPKIYEMRVASNVSNRFAHTTITSKVKNLADKAQEATFSVVLPESAYIAGFIMEVGGKNYTAYVKEKEEAKKTYDEAVASGQGAAHVAVSARDSNRFTVSVNVEPKTKAAFYLSYEELLKRRDGHYELVINLHPGQPVKDMSVEVAISESRKITDLKAPPLRSGNEVAMENAELDPRADIEKVNDTAAVVRFSPNVERQKQLAHILKTNEDDGLAGQFVVQYDVERDPTGGEVLLQDGYFVHFFAPSDLQPLPKHVVFVLDTSGSMYDRKIEQLKEAMASILQELKEKDIFNLVEFNSNVKTWDLNNENSSVWYPSSSDSWYNSDPDKNLNDFEFPAAYPANPDNIKKAKDTVSKFRPEGGTNIQAALKVGLHLIEMAKKKEQKEASNPQPIIIFLTDGDPTVGESRPENIVKYITEFNSGQRKSPVFALSFGDSADRKFLQKLSLRNSGFTKHIYEAADASLQLQDFYRQISSPLLSNVSFKYTPETTSLTKTVFPILFGGTELVVAGFCGSDKDFDKIPRVSGWGITGPIDLIPKVAEPVTGLERLWAYLTVQQVLEQMESADNNKEELKKKALDLALKYSFVTSVSSLVVVKPNDTKAVDTEDAAKQPRPDWSMGQPVFGSPGLAGPPGLAGFSGGGAGFGGSFAATSLSAPAPAGFPMYAAKPQYMLVSAQRPQTPMLAESFPDSSFDVIKDHIVENHMIVLSTTTRIPLTSRRPPNLMTILPWLKDILNDNGTLTSPPGNYLLGLDANLPPAKIDCPNAPNNTTGHCTLLKACPEIHSLLVSTAVFVEHFCPLQQYAGVCCPQS